MKKVAIIGATGYTGRELVRLLLAHPKVKIDAVSSEQYAGQLYSDIYPEFRHRFDAILEPLKVLAIARRVELAFLCLPHGKSAKTAKAFLDKGVRVIDLSADFRLKSLKDYETWYEPHPCPKLLKEEAVYSLPELNPKAIRGERLIGNPGCYPTSIALGVAPLLAGRALAPGTIICDSKSGTSGAGRSAAVEQLFAEVTENFFAYKIATHRHVPEIEQLLSQVAGEKIVVQFTPHLLPIARGILSTIYVKPLRKWREEELRKLYRDFYRGKPFVRLLPKGKFPQVKNVASSNFCDIGLTYDERTEMIVIVSAIDNLTKGASGQAIQNMNLVFGWKETTGLL